MQNLNYGSLLPFQGKKYPIVAKYNIKTSFDGKCFYVPPSLNSEKLLDEVIKIYKGLAKRIMYVKVNEFSNIMSLNPPTIKINSAKKRWGSCAKKGSVNFCFYLLFGTSDVVDYVVVHELAHLKEFNHSKRFWNIVECFMPDYKKAEFSLKILEKYLHEEGWK